MKQWNFLREQLSKMIQQMFSAEEAVMDRLASQGREIFGLVWENTEGPSPIQVWRKKDRFEMRFGNRVVQSSCLRSDPNQLLLSYTRHMMLCLLLVPEPRKVLHIGLGGGTIANFLHRLFPEVEQTVIEINEAFASVALRYMKDLDVDHSITNVNGGSIAMGHPLGATGAMLVSTMLDELERRQLKRAMLSLCVGGGMGISCLIERV